MFVKKVKRKCSVRGCKNTECFAISRTREIGNTVIICKSCLGNALASLDEVDPETKTNIPVNDAPAPALFYNAQALGLDTKTETPENLVDDDKDKQENTTPPADDKGENGQGDVIPPADSGDTVPPASDADGVTPPTDDLTPPTDDLTPPADGVTPGNTTGEFVCPKCGRAFDSEKGLNTHLRYCKGQSEE